MLLGLFSRNKIFLAVTDGCIRCLVFPTLFFGSQKLLLKIKLVFIPQVDGAIKSVHWAKHWSCFLNLRVAFLAKSSRAIDVISSEDLIQQF